MDLLTNGQTPIFYVPAEPRQNKAMKTTLTSNWRPLLRAFYPFLIAAAALWAMPKNARAQLYVTELPGGGDIGVVGKYDAKTGAAISPSFITGLSEPEGDLAVLGNTLFVANTVGNTVGKYDANTGAPIVLSPSPFITGVNFPVGLAVSGNKLFVANAGQRYGWHIRRYHRSRD